MDIEEIRQSPRQFVDLETVEWLSDRVMVLEMQLAEAQQDAERYRWLAKGADEGDGGWLIEVFVDGAPSLETLDAAIDAAMKWGE